MSPVKPTSAQEQAGLDIAGQLRRAGFLAYWVGGCVRNRLLGLPSEDVDVVTDARPPQVVSLFPDARLVGAKFGVCVVPFHGVQTEVATFRTEGPYTDHRHPDAVEFAGPEDDARRRDFTINAIYFDPIEERIIDYVGGRDDLGARLIRCVGDPERRITEDALRILRAIRFAARLEFTIEEKTFQSLRAHRKDLELISPERIRDELVRMVCGPHPGRALDLLDSTGALEVILPEVADLRGVDQPPQFHPEGDVWTHTKAALEALENPSPTLAMAALLHDVGKAPTYEEAEDRIRFNNHDDVGAEIAERVCNRLRFSNDETQAIVAMVRRHMTFLQIRKMRPAKVARFLAAPTIDEELELHRADCVASHGGLENFEFAKAHLEAARSQHPEVLPPPLITGHDLIAMGYKPGPVFAKILEAVEEEQIEGRLTSPEQARDWVREQYPAG